MRPLAVVMPRNTQEAATALRVCYANRQPVTIQGGLTGLSGGAVAGEGEIALSTERMRGIEEVDVDAGTIIALAGTPIEEIQRAAEEHGYMCGIDLGSRGSCTIGGTVATNAGGNRVIQYGMARQNVTGLEAVLADGTIVSSLSKMVKNNTGYDWPQILAGSEGTLGLITRVVVRLHPLPRNIVTAALSIGSFESALRVLHRLQEAFPRQVLAFEVMWREFQEYAAALCDCELPFADAAEILVLTEICHSNAPGMTDALEEQLAEVIEKGWAADAIVATSKAQVDRLWEFRDATSLYKSRGYSIGGYDISIPIGSIASAVEYIRKETAQRTPEIPVYCFGHAADSNIHICALTKNMKDPLLKTVDDIVYACVRMFGGSVSAEHGIGRIKLPYLPITRSEPEIALMRTLKSGLDPQCILSRGRVLPPAQP